MSSEFIAPLLACALQFPQVGTCDKSMRTALVLQVGGGDRENLCSVCGTLCRDSSIFTSSHKPIGITAAFVLRTALKKWNWSLDLVRLKKATQKIVQVVSEGSTAHV